MDIFIVVLKAVLVLLGVGSVGFWVARRGIIPENTLGSLVQLAVDVALPCMIFTSILVNFSPSNYPGWWQLPLWWFPFTLAALALTLITMFLSAKKTRGEFAMNLFFQNGLFVPLVVITGIFGADSTYLPQLYLFVFLHPVMFFSTYHLFIKGSQERFKWNRIINLVLVSTLLAFGVQLFGVKRFVPDFVVSILDSVGMMAIPLIMIILGGSLYLDFRQKGRIYWKEIVKFVIVKNVVFPLVFLGILLIWRPAYNIALMFFLQSAIPPVTATPILTERAGGNKAISNQFVFSSFIAAIATVPLAFLVFSRFFVAP
jgi:predicted permease